MRRRVLIATAVLLAGSIGFLVVWGVRATPQVRDRIIAALNERFASKVNLESLEVAIVPPRIAGDGLTLRHNGRTDVPPLISVRKFEASAGVFGLTGRPVHLRTITLDELAIRVPPGGLKTGNNNDHDEPHVAHEERPSPILIDKLVARSAQLQIISRNPNRLPRVFDIHDLVMDDFGMPGGARFQAGLTNPVPRGRVETSGLFGPWHADEPGLTPLSGDYIFKNADMNVIKGIGGTLSSVGNYRGMLERIEVEGQTEIPDFSIDIAGQTVPLSTRFKAVVDGTNGDTFLENVEAKLQDTTILAKGSVVRTEDVKGRHIALDIKIAEGRLEDLMRLAVKSEKPPLKGRIDMETKFLMPAGPADVVDRLQLAGVFTLAQATFMNVNVQKRITMLSRRGRGEEDDTGAEGESVVSNLRGKFVMRDARLSFSELTFSVPGSTVRLSGQYDLHTETINFVGDLLLDASLADMTSGYKSVLARMAQPFFRRPGGGSRLPIKISGTKDKPAFGLDVGRVFGG